MVEIGDIYSHKSITFVVQVLKIDLLDGEMLYCKILDAYHEFAITYPIGSTYILNAKLLYLYKKINTIPIAV